MRRRVILTILFAATCLSAGERQGTKLDLREVVGLSGEIGMAAIRGNMISMFSNKDIFIEDPNGGGPKLQKRDSGVVSLIIQDSRWTRAEKNLDISAASDPALCDPLNQIDISPTLGKLPLALPKSSKVKIVRELGDSAIAVYSTSVENTYGYDVRIALLQLARDGNYVLIKQDTATEYGRVCGLQTAGDSHFVVLADEPAASSDFLALYVYEVVR